MIYLGDFPAGATVYVPFETFAVAGESITMTGLAVGDILVYKNGSTTQRSSTSGFTLLDTDGIDFDGLTGLHGFSINLADDTDAGFFAAGNEYWVALSDVTVDSKTVRSWVAAFSIERASGALARIKAAQDGTTPVYSVTDQGKRIAAQIDVSGIGIVEEYLPVEHADSKVTVGDTTGAFSAAEIGYLGAIDANTVTIGETASGAGIDCQLRFAGMESYDIPSEVHVVGRYQGATNHWVGVQAWNYRTSAWEYLHVNNSANGMAHSTTEQSYRFPLSQAHFDAGNGVTLVRFLHNGTTPNNSHTGLVLNKVACDFRYTEATIQNATYAYNADGTLNTITLASGTVLTYSYTNGRRTGVTVS